MVLRTEDMGKQIVQVLLKADSDERSRWAEVRYERDIKLVDAGVGPVKTVNRVYSARDVPTAAQIYAEEVAKQGKMPESKDRVGAQFIPKEIGQAGDEQDSLAACNESCNTREYNRLHQRTVFRYQNAVVVLYTWGAPDSASPAQMNEWLPKNRERL